MTAIRWSRQDGVTSMPACAAAMYIATYQVFIVQNAGDQQAEAPAVLVNRVNFGMSSANLFLSGAALIVDRRLSGDVAPPPLPSPSLLPVLDRVREIGTRIRLRRRYG